MSALVILVNADPRALRHLEALLSEDGYLVAASNSFLEARDLLNSVTPDLLVADVRLERFNGLQLAIRSRLEHADVPVIVTNFQEDPIAEAEAKRYGVSFIAAPMDNPEFLPNVRSLVDSRRGTERPMRRWPRKAVAGALEVRAAADRAQLVNMSYGGAQLAFDLSVAIPHTFDITLQPVGVTVQATRIWTREDGDHLSCGAEVLKAGEHDWRRIVDALPGNAAH